jgi:predicted nucleic acid-binding protein
MHLVVDTNILFSALLKQESKIRNFLTEPNNYFYAPQLIAEEIFKNLNKLLRFTQLTENELESLLFLLFQHIHFINEKTVSSEKRNQAFNLCKDVDPADTPFVALSLETGYPLWTGDQKLKQHLQKIGFDNFFTLK